MWTCEHCGEDVEPHFDACWNCSASRRPTSSTVQEGVSAASAVAATLGPDGDEDAPPSPARRGKRSASTSARSRYNDAYIVAHSTIAHGNSVKALGIVFGALILVTGLLLTQQLGITVLVVSAIAEVAVASGIYGVGVVIAAQGQVLLATLDTAVNSSPFLSENEKAKVMSL